jgi:hypothetical protein
MSRTIILKLDAGRSVTPSLCKIAEFDLSKAVLLVLGEKDPKTLEAMRQKLMCYLTDVENAQARLKYPHLFEEKRLSKCQVFKEY